MFKGDCHGLLLRSMAAAVNIGRRDTRLTDASPPPHASLVATPASTEVGRVVNAILAVVAATNEAPTKRSFAKCILM